MTAPTSAQAMQRLLDALLREERERDVPFPLVQARHARRVDETMPFGLGVERLEPSVR